MIKLTNINRKGKYVLLIKHLFKAHATIKIKIRKLDLLRKNLYELVKKWNTNNIITDGVASIRNYATFTRNGDCKRSVPQSSNP